MAKANPLVVNISAAKAQLSKLVAQVVNGEEVIVGKAGQPLVRLVKCSPAPQPRKPGALKRKIKIAKDFDELPVDLAKAFGLIDD